MVGGKYVFYYSFAESKLLEFEISVRRFCLGRRWRRSGAPRAQTAEPGRAKQGPGMPIRPRPEMSRSRQQPAETSSKLDSRGWGAGLPR